MKNLSTSIALSLIFTIGFAFINPVNACHESSLILDGVTNLGGNSYQIDMTFCAEGGEGVHSITQPTRTFAFIVDGALITSFQSPIVSPQTGASYSGYFHNNQADTLIYLDPGVDWTCTSGCGPGQPYCISITLITDGLPTSIFLIGAEGAGNPYGGCLGADMYVYPAGNAPDPCTTFPISVNAGNNKTVYYGWGPAECAYLCASTSGSPSYPLTYSWSNGVNNQSMTVCPSTSTTYTVTVTDNNGCTATDEVYIDAIDVRCGKKNEKILLCNPDGSKTKCEKYSKVQQKLNQGYTLGPCSGNAFIGTPTTLHSVMDAEDFLAYPTVFSNELIVKVNFADAEFIQVDMYNMYGALVKQIYKGSNTVQTFEIPTHDLASQTYILRMILDSGDVSTLKVVKAE